MVIQPQERIRPSSKSIQIVRGRESPIKLDEDKVVSILGRVTFKGAIIPFITMWEFAQEKINSLRCLKNIL